MEGISIMPRGGARQGAGAPPGNLNRLRHGKESARLDALLSLVPDRTEPWVLGAVGAVVYLRDYHGASGRRPSYSRAIARVRDLVLEAVWTEARTEDERHTRLVEALRPLVMRAAKRSLAEALDEGHRSSSSHRPDPLRREQRRAAGSAA